MLLIVDVRTVQRSRRQIAESMNSKPRIAARVFPHTSGETNTKGRSMFFHQFDRWRHSKDTSRPTSTFYLVLQTSYNINRHLLHHFFCRPSQYHCCSAVSLLQKHRSLCLCHRFHRRYQGSRNQVAFSGASSKSRRVRLTDTTLRLWERGQNSKSLRDISFAITSRRDSQLGPPPTVKGWDFSS